MNNPLLLPWLLGLSFLALGMMIVGGGSWWLLAFVLPAFVVGLALAAVLLRLQR